MDDLISRKAALDAIMGQPPEPHYPSWYAAQIEKLPAVQPATSCSEIPNSSTDCISRQAAIDALDCISGVEEVLRSLPSAQPEQRWIPVTERLPENDNEVLITVWDAEDDYVEVYKGFYQGHEWWTQWCHGCSKIKDEPCGENIVIAWMPLPASYKGE